MSIRRPLPQEGPLGELLDALRQLHLTVGEPAVRQIARLSADQVGRDTVHRLLTTSKTPRWHTLAAVVRALGGDVERFQILWIAARSEKNDA